MEECIRENWCDNKGREVWSVSINYAASGLGGMTVGEAEGEMRGAWCGWWCEF